LPLPFGPKIRIFIFTNPFLRVNKAADRRHRRLTTGKSLS